MSMKRSPMSQNKANETTTRRLTRRKLLAATATLGTVPLSGCLSVLPLDQPSGSIRVPEQTNIGDPLRIYLRGFASNTTVTLEATATDARGVTYKQYWSLQTNDQGEATLSDPESGNSQSESTWYGPNNAQHVSDRSGAEMMLQQMNIVNGFAKPDNFVIGDKNNTDITLEARSGLLQRLAAQTSLSRVYINPKISRRSINAKGLVGWLYTPPTPGPHPGIITLHGSQAFVLHELSRLLATQGYATLALKYFDAPGLPSYVENIPLEYFKKAIHWLTGQEQVTDRGIGLVGFSRGVEAALLAAANYEGPATVVGYSGGGVAVQGARGIPPQVFTDRAAWTRNGTPVAPAKPIQTVFETVQEEVYQHRCDVESVPEAVRSRVSKGTLNQALIPVEEIDGPVLLLAGASDQQWPSAPLAALTINRLKRKNHPYPYGLRTFCDAGHIFQYPYRDYTGGPTSDANGGTPKANEQAAADSWPLALAYLSSIKKKE